MRARGQSLSTYALALAVIAVIGIAALVLLGGQTSQVLSISSGTI